MRQRRKTGSASKSMQAPLLAPGQGDERGGGGGGGWRSWLPCTRSSSSVPSNAETVQNLIGVLDGLGMAKLRADADYTKKFAQVEQLAKQGHQRQAWESMQTAKQHRRRWERCHAMEEQVQQIKARIMEQQHNALLFSSFSEANTLLARMIEATPLESIDALLDTLSERMADTREASEALANGALAPAAVDEDELRDFLAQRGSSSAAPLVSTPAAAPAVPVTAPVPLVMLAE
jgi:hypothetical protein